MGREVRMLRPLSNIVRSLHPGPCSTMSWKLEINMVNSESNVPCSYMGISSVSKWSLMLLMPGNRQNFAKQYVFLEKQPKISD